MTLRLAQDRQVIATGLPDALPNGPGVTLNSVDRENGLFLRSVSFSSQEPSERHMRILHKFEQRSQYAVGPERVFSASLRNPGTKAKQ